MEPRTPVRKFSSLDECAAWVKVEAAHNRNFSQEEMRGLTALWEKGTCFSTRVSRGAHHVEALLAAVNLIEHEFMLITRDVSSVYSELDSLSDFFENGSCCLRWVAHDGTIIRANKQELEYLGYPRDQYIGQKIQKFYVHQEVLQDFFRRLEAGERLVDCEAAFWHADGTIRWLLINSSVRFSATGEFLHTRCFSQDITARKKLEMDLHLAQQEADAANLAKDQFLASLSHELRTPLTPVLLLLSMLREDSRLPPDVHEQLATMQHNTETEVRLIGDLIDLTSIRRGNLCFSMREVDLHTLIEEAHSMLFVGEVNSNRTCKLDLMAARHIVWGDPARLQQVFRNILRNSIKFTPNGGQITVKTANETANTISMDFTDNGLGMPPDKVAHIFEAFSEPASLLSGLGLDLSISRSIIETHHGKISAHSEGAGTGMTIYVELPLQAGTTPALPSASPAALSTALTAVSSSTVPPVPSVLHSAAPSTSNDSPSSTPLAQSLSIANTPSPSAPRLADVSSSQQPTPVGNSSPVKVLVVEDNATCRAVFVRAIKTRLGYHVDEALSVAGALAQLRSHAYDLIVSDIGLPDGTGHELLREVRRLEAHRRVPAIAVTGFGMQRDVEMSMRVGFDRHLTKPVSMKALEGAIKDVLPCRSSS